MVSERQNCRDKIVASTPILAIMVDLIRHMRLGAPFPTRADGNRA
jgi:hypothetical protein